MKNIVMVQGMGNNERGWADVVSRHGRVTLIQLGMLTHVEVWEGGQRTFCGPEVRMKRWIRQLDEALLGALGFLRAIKLIRETQQGAPVDLVLTGSHSSGLAGVFLRKTGQVRRVVTVLTDHLPPSGSFLKRTHRWMTGRLNQLAVRWADEAWAVSPRIPAMAANPRNYVVPLRVNLFPTAAGPRGEVGYVGFPSADHALENLFDICRRHEFRLNIIGDSPYLQSIKHLAPPGTVFHGLLNDEQRIGEIFARCFCGYAVYLDTSVNSYSHYGIPSKTLYYFASNVPTVITDVAYFTRTIAAYGVGKVVPPEPAAIEAAVVDMYANYTAYSAAIERFRTEWNIGVEEFHRQRLAELLGS